MTQNKSPSRELYSNVFKIHHWLGLTLGFYFMLMGLSGAFLVYTWQFESWLNPSLRRSETSSDHIQLARVINAGVRGTGAETLPRSYFAPGNSSLNVAMTFRDVEKNQAASTAFVDPSTLEYRGSMDPEKSLSEFLFDFHHELFLGESGKILVAGLGIITVMLLSTGLYLIASNPRIFWRTLKFPRYRAPYQYVHNLHKFWGAYTILLMLIITVSGVYIAKPELFQAAKEKTNEAPKASFKGAGFDSLDLVEFARGMKAIGLKQRPLRLQFQANKVLVRAIDSNDQERVFHYYYALRVFEENAPEAFDMEVFQHDLHVGHYWGEIGGALTFLGGMSTFFFFASGVWMTFRKRRNQ